LSDGAAWRVEAGLEITREVTPWEVERHGPVAEGADVGAEVELELGRVHGDVARLPSEVGCRINAPPSEGARGVGEVDGLVAHREQAGECKPDRLRRGCRR
jgi:hypothetical protein